MRVLFDHSLPIGIRQSLTHHEVVVAKNIGRQELGNRDFLKAAEKAGFDVMARSDQNIT